MLTSLHQMSVFKMANGISLILTALRGLLCQRWYSGRNDIGTFPNPEIKALLLTQLNTSGGPRNMQTVKARQYFLKHPPNDTFRAKTFKSI